MDKSKEMPKVAPTLQPAKGGPVLSAAAVEVWIDESVASAPPPDKMHILTHLKSCIPALMERLK